MRTVIEKNASTPMRRIAPTFGIHFPRRSDTMATVMENQMKTSLKK